MRSASTSATGATSTPPRSIRPSGPSSTRWRSISAEGDSLFERPHHRRIAALLGALDADLLAANACWFGGGTAMALRYGEYRESVDIDFLVSEVAGYRELRGLLTGPEGVAAIVRPGASLQSVRE